MNSENLRRDRLSSSFFEWIIVFVQVLTYFVSVLPLRALYRVCRILPDNLEKIDKGTLVIANHQSHIDPFVIVMHLPFLSYWKILPIYFPATAVYMRRPILGFCMRLLGCYDVGVTKQERMRTFFSTRALLKNKKTVFIFPEGHISRAEIKDFQRGIEFFLSDAPQFIFVRIKGFNQISWKRIWNTDCHIQFSPIHGSDMRFNTSADMKEYLLSFPTRNSHFKPEFEMSPY